MIAKNALLRFGLVAALSIDVLNVGAQDIHFTQFDAAPLTINPAFTGMFNGQFRATAIYRSQWQTITHAYETYGASVDMPILWSNSGYLAGGLQLYNDKAGDGNLTNFTGMVSLAYHLTTKGLTARDNDAKRTDFAVGLQAGYSENSIDLSKLYFGDEYVNGSFVPGSSQEYQLGLGNHVNYYLVNAGISLSHSFSRKASITVGAGANNINQPVDAIEQKVGSQSQLPMCYTGELGMDLIVGDRLSFRPAVLYQYQASATELVAGNEFHFVMGQNLEPELNSFTTSIFLGGWVRTGDAVMITAGMEIKKVRFGISYDYNMSNLSTVSNGNGGYEISLKYISPWSSIYGGSRSVPCIRF
jgi:type IX secretion system PorP/SprF family membrane protein